MDKKFMFNTILASPFHLNKVKWPSILIMILSLLLTTSACNISPQQGSGGELSESAVDVFVEPSGERPLVFVTNGGTKICRRGLPDESVYGLAPDEVKAAENDEATTGGEAGDTTAQQQSGVDTLTTDVGDNWFQMGLLIVNKSKSYFLVIEQLMFFISANYGSDLLTHRATISSGYCGTDPLYIIPPTRKDAKPGAYAGDRYQPARKKYINNLTLYISDIPIPEGPPPQEEDDDGGSDSLSGIRANAQAATQTTPRAPEEFVLTYLPNYRVQLLLNGYWIDRERKNVANFRKKINFSLSSQFLN
jgi:hypothetical protein